MTHRNYPNSIIVATLSLHLLSTLALAGDWSQWLGPNGNKIAQADSAFDPDLDHWKIAWQLEVGLGYSAITTANGKAYTAGHDSESKEAILCLDSSNGKILWKHSYAADLLPKMHVGGPNASPTIIGDRLYFLSKDGQAICLNAHTGEKIWTTRLTEILDMDIPRWGFASSPVEYSDQILLSAGKVAALDKNSGRPNWISAHAHPPGYATPVVFHSGTQELIAAFDSGGLSILSAENGQEIARHPIEAKYNLTAATPTVINDGQSIFLSINTKSELLNFDGSELTTKWSDRKIQNYTSGNVLIDGTLYGIDGGVKTVKSKLYALNFETGETYWSVPEYGYASLIAVSDTLLILTENGELVTARASKESYSEISRIKLLEPICWTNPVYANGRIYVRNELGTLICLERS